MNSKVLNISLINANAPPVSLIIVFKLKKETFIKYQADYSFFLHINPNAPELAFIQI